MPGNCSAQPFPSALLLLFFYFNTLNLCNSLHSASETAKRPPVGLCALLSAVAAASLAAPTLAGTSGPGISLALNHAAPRWWQFVSNALLVAGWDQLLWVRCYRRCPSPACFAFKPQRHIEAETICAAVFAYPVLHLWLSLLCSGFCFSHTIQSQASSLTNIPATPLSPSRSSSCWDCSAA